MRTNSCKVETTDFDGKKGTTLDVDGKRGKRCVKEEVKISAFEMRSGFQIHSVEPIG